MNAFKYARPESLAAARSLFASSGARVDLKAGGTDLLGRLKEGTARPDMVIHLGAIRDLGADIVLAADGSLAIGALATLASVAAHRGLRGPFRAVAEAADQAATPQIRNVGTVGGNLGQRPRCWYFRDATFHCLKKGGEMCYAVDGENRYHAIFGNATCNIVHPSNLAPALLALDATVHIATAKETRSVPLSGFFVRPEEDVTRECILRDGDILTRVTVPAPAAGTRSSYFEAREKLTFDWALAACAAAVTLEGGKVAAARIVLTAVSPVPVRLRRVEEALVGKPLAEETIAAAAAFAAEGATPLRDNVYKVELVKAVTRRALSACRFE